MEIRNVTSIFFSPTGSTRRLVSMLSKTFPSKPREVDITPYTQRGLSMDFGPDDLVLFGVPVYGGRIPSPAVQTLRRMQGSRTPAVLVAAYGNREYDDALLELADIAAANGFIPFAAAALIAEHSIMHSVAAGRPDAQDAKKIEAFGTQLWKKLSTSEALSPVSVKGTHPYKEFGGVPGEAVPAAESAPRFALHMPSPLTFPVVRIRTRASPVCAASRCVPSTPAD